MQVNTSFVCNGIVLISSPRLGEEGTSRRIAEDLNLLAISLSNFEFSHVWIKSARQLIDFLQSLELKIKNGFRPILHFDVHGSKEYGLEIGITGEFVGWDTITDNIRELNSASDNNLFVFVAACYGAYLLKSLNITKPSPFFIMCGPLDIVTFGEVEASVVPFYKELFKNESINIANQALQFQIEYYHSERIFLLLFAKYIREKCLGKGVKKRREQLLTKSFEEIGFNNTRQMRKLLRQEIKKSLKPTPELMSKFAKRFLYGQECSVSFAEIMSEVKRSYT